MNQTCIQIRIGPELGFQDSIYWLCSPILLYTPLRATQPSLRFYYKNSQGFILTNQLSCKIRSKFNSYRNSMILDVSESSFNCLQLSFIMFSQIRFRTVLKITKHNQTLFILWVLNQRTFYLIPHSLCVRFWWVMPFRKGLFVLYDFRVLRFSRKYRLEGQNSRLLVWADWNNGEIWSLRSSRGSGV